MKRQNINFTAQMRVCKTGPQALLVRVQVSTHSLEDSWQYLSKSKMHLPIDTTIPLLDFILLINSIYMQRHEHAIVKGWK